MLSSCAISDLLKLVSIKFILKTENSTIPAGSLVLLLFDQMNRDPAIWGPTAELFDPDRFAADIAATRHPWSFLPFSGGPRNCIGIKHAHVSVRTILTHLLLTYRFSTPLKLADIRVKMDVTLKIVNKNPMHYEPIYKVQE